ncbi:DUF72 domain-containing protein [Tatlockia micdadei]|uniref:DUF72 domain-containing protein n=1 Tax=Legionella micdadei TaxID=451 RepID=UPI0015709C15|nr:DUF72 domain-containing protein [Legionella micdadei]NSL17086.1 DUF72 domain-containing protein [Legionella micdadei]
MEKNGLFIGTSGWSYADWKGLFYPNNLRMDELLHFYAGNFNTVELNNSFYKLPTVENVKRWYELTPPDFIFSCKANRYITHMKKLQGTEKNVENLLTVLNHFHEKLGPILFQFPPHWHNNYERLNSFIKNLSKQFNYTFEFRDTSWFSQEIYDLLDANQISLCLYDYRGYQSPEMITAKFVYLRLHGPKQEPYTGSYSEQKLTEYAQKIVSWKKEGRSVYCYFDNDIKSCAPRNASCLKEMAIHLLES